MTTVIDVQPSQVAAWMEIDAAIVIAAIVIDVRESNELLQARLPGTRHVPLSTFDPQEIPVKSREKLVFFCAHGVRSRQVAQWLIDHGYLTEAHSMTGGIVAWASQGLPVETGVPAYQCGPLNVVRRGVNAN